MSVNLPHLVLPSRLETHRIVHLHQNVPGVLATINGVLADNKVNIEGQLLGTRGELGYVITDIGVDYPAGVPDELAAMAETVRLRVLS
jgi:D-3-phosphoglycerate dehydrogenase